MRGGRESRRIDADLGHDDVCHDVTDARHRRQDPGAFGAPLTRPPRASSLLELCKQPHPGSGEPAHRGMGCGWSLGEVGR